MLVEIGLWGQMIEAKRVEVLATHPSRLPRHWSGFQVGVQAWVAIANFALCVA
jgi:hypothetical protein